jgi:crotonobetainyl-CoA:carnitine CoA-transferase CaiB-like acyl-CoA transferase
VERGAPLVGEHTDEILKQAGFSDERIAALAASGAIATGKDC